MPAHLEVVAGKASGMSIMVHDELLIGRQSVGAGRLADDEEISRAHARVTLDANGYCAIEDLGSTNGTFVNGLRISSPRTLAAGDTIELGGTTLVVREIPVPAIDPAAGEAAIDRLESEEVPQPTIVPDIEPPSAAVQDLPPLVAPATEEQLATHQEEVLTPAGDEELTAAAPTVLSLHLEIDFAAHQAKIAFDDASEAVHLVFEDGAWRPVSRPASDDEPLR